MDGKKSIDEFTKIIDEALEKNDVKMLIEMPAGTQDCVLKDNTALGPIVQFYILIAAMKTAYMGFAEIIDETKEEELVDEVFDLLKQDILEKMKEARKEAAE